MQYHVLAYYAFENIENPEAEVALHKEFCEARDIRGRLYISAEGINGQMSASPEASLEYQNWLKGRTPFTNVVFKTHYWHEHAFEKLIIKHRKQLVAIDCPIDMAKTGDRLSPEQWREMIETDKNHILVDVRNDYEWEVGRFEGSDTPPCKTFREFRQYAEDLKTKIDPKNTPVMMCCTGGIRCELYSAYLKEKGFEKVYQLDGGIINYGLKEGGKHWLGKLYVFDDRMTVPISKEETPVIGKCRLCQAPTEAYYNCANMDCNDLYLCCPDCVKKFKGCCSEKCQSAPRLRPYHEQNPHKPFRKKHRYFQTV